MKHWEVINKQKTKNKEQKIEDIIEVLLTNRGLKNDKEKNEFLNPPDPYSLTAKEVGIDTGEFKKAEKRIREAIEKNEKIIVYGDYDTDGVCATAIMWESLYNAGAKALPFIPNRDEGYGMKVEKIEEFAKDNIKLIITVDQGIVAYDQIARASKLGIDVIITDHHLPGIKTPEAFAIVHTTVLSGSGVSWFLANKIKENSLDLVSIGTISDMMPLIGPNRAIVHWGLKKIAKTKKPGLIALFKIAGIDPENIGTYEIGYLIGPRLNAAGRMEDPMNALRLVCVNNEFKALELAKKLDEYNKDRQVLMEQTLIEARQMWLSEKGKSNLIFLAGENWEHGIIGLVAGRMVEEFYRPAIVIAQEGEFSRASARSIRGFDMVKAIESCVDILGAHGGHAMAAGFSLETVKLAEVKKRLMAEADKIDPQSFSPVIKIDSEINPENINENLYENLRKFEPFGIGNPEPVFLTENLEIVESRCVGREGKHLSLNFRSDKLLIKGIGFNLGNLFSTYSLGDNVDVVYNLSINEWNGKRDLQLKVKDFKKNE